MTVNKLLKILTVPLLLGIGGGTFAVKAGQTAADADAPLTCEISARLSGTSVSIHGIARADAPTEGIYRLNVKSVGGANRTDISQGGGFATDGNGEAVLGNVSLGGSATSYSVDMLVKAGGLEASCTGIVDPRA